MRPFRSAPVPVVPRTQVRLRPEGGHVNSLLAAISNRLYERCTTVKSEALFPTLRDEVAANIFDEANVAVTS
jgi:hypothetical protein